VVTTDPAATTVRAGTVAPGRRITWVPTKDYSPINTGADRCWLDFTSIAWVRICDRQPANVANRPTWTRSVQSRPGVCSRYRRHYPKPVLASFLRQNAAHRGITRNPVSSTDNCIPAEDQILQTPADRKVADSASRRSSTCFDEIADRPIHASVARFHPNTRDKIRRPATNGAVKSQSS
jgi:hypothetical protein